MFLVASDFNSGKFRISQNPETITSLTAYIAKYEPRYLQNLLGVTLYNLFIADLTAGVLPFQTTIYDNLYQPFAEDNANSGYVFSSLSGDYLGPSVLGYSDYPKIIRSEGIKEMLKGFIHFEFVRDQAIENTATGNVDQQIENGSKLKPYQSGLKEKFNEAVNTYQAIQYYISQHNSSYPDFKGIPMCILGHIV